jgi:hypothetical protein
VKNTELEHDHDVSRINDEYTSWAHSEGQEKYLWELSITTVGYFQEKYLWELSITTVGYFTGAIKHHSREGIWGIILQLEVNKMA